MAEKSRFMRRSDLVSGTFFSLAGVAIVWESIRLGTGSLHNPGTAFFGLLSGVVLMVFSIALILQAHFRRPITSEDSGEKSRWRNILLLAAAIVVYTLVLESLGYILSTFLLMLFLFRGIKAQPWWVVGVASTVSTACSNILFQVLLKIELPRGLFGI